MTIRVSRGTENLSADHPDGLTEVAIAMAAMSRRWGSKRSVDALRDDFERIIEIAREDPRTKVEELQELDRKGRQICALEELAQSYRATEDEAGETLPRYHGYERDALRTLYGYGSALGVKVEVLP